MHHTTGIFANVILYLGAWSLTIYLRGLHVDLHENQSFHQLNQGYYSSYGTFCSIKSAHAQQHLFCYPNSTIRFNNMIITYDSVNTIMIMQPVLQVAIQSQWKAHIILAISIKFLQELTTINSISKIFICYDVKIHSRILQQ